MVKDVPQRVTEHVERVHGQRDGEAVDVVQALDRRVGDAGGPG